MKYQVIRVNKYSSYDEKVVKVFDDYDAAEDYALNMSLVPYMDYDFYVERVKEKEREEEEC